MKRAVAGFTLLELIVVIGIFAVFSVMAYGGLNTVLTARARIEENLSRTEAYERAYLRLRNDLQNAAPRPVRDENGTLQPAFLHDSFNNRIDFTRAGWANYLGLPRSTLERVSYRLEELDDASERAGNSRRGTAGRSSGSSSFRDRERRLVRRSWAVLDRANQTEPLEVTVLDRVRRLDWRFLDANGQRSETWPASGASTLLGAEAAEAPGPTAIELTLDTSDWGELRMLFRLGAEGAAKIPELRKPPTPAAPAPGTAPDAPGGSKPEPPADDDGAPTE